MLTSTAADTPTVSARLQAWLCLSPQRTSHDRFSTCLFKNKTKHEYSFIPSLALATELFFYHPTSSNLPALTGVAALAWPFPFIAHYLCLPLTTTFPSDFLTLHQTLLPLPLPGLLSLRFKVTGECCLHVLK